VPINFALIPETRDTVWLAIPLAIPVVALVAGLALAVAAANILFRDIEHIVAALLLPWFFLTPIMYSFDAGGPLAGPIEHHHTLVEFLRYGNFLTPPIEAVRDPLFWGKMPRAGDVIYLCGAALVALVLGAFVFRRVDDRIAVEL
jgi:ABC-type polysaccharide/polyol phosphate export permease